MINLDTTIRRHLRIDEVAKACNVSRRLVYYWIKHEIVSSVVLCGTRQIPIDDVRRQIQNPDRRRKPVVAQFSPSQQRSA
jgi:hypothetical protein